MLSSRYHCLFVCLIIIVINLQELEGSYDVEECPAKEVKRFNRGDRSDKYSRSKSSYSKPTRSTRVAKNPDGSSRFTIAFDCQADTTNVPEEQNRQKCERQLRKSLPMHYNVWTSLGMDLKLYKPGMDFDLFWVQRYPWSVKELGQQLKDLKSHQRVNHFPGELFTTKAILNSIPFSSVPKTFNLPKQSDAFIDYHNANPQEYWVEKGTTHRGVVLKTFEEIDTSERILVQEFISNPLLVDGHMYDIGIYVAVTSINPLRVYISDQWRFKVNKHEYYPFDATKQERYVIKGADAALPNGLSLLPSVKDYVNVGHMTDKEAYLTYLTDQGYNASSVESSIASALREMFLKFEPTMMKGTAKHSDTSRHFFALYRADFMIDTDLKVHLIECNMSPDMTMSHKKNFLQSVLYGLFKLVGIANPVIKDINYRDDNNTQIQVTTRDIIVNREECLQANCDENCYQEVCRFWPSCMSADDVADLKAAYLEHINRHNYQRILPKLQEEDVDEVTELSERNQWMADWFTAKCAEDNSWCH